VVEPGEGDEAFLKHRDCPWYHWHKRLDILEEDQPGCDPWFSTAVAEINKTLGTNIKIETQCSLPGGGPNEATAEEALAAIDVFAESNANGTAKIGWRWASKKEENWLAQVSFDIQGPAAIDLDATTHNGAVNAQGLGGAVKVKSHNGAITVASTGRMLDAEVHNGEISATYTGDELRLRAHNGRIVADLARCGAVSGSVEAHNGEVVINVGDATSTDVLCTTHSGPINCDVPLRNVEKSKRKLTGTMGEGGGSLVVKTHNGQVQIKGVDGRS